MQFIAIPGLNYVDWNKLTLWIKQAFNDNDYKNVMEVAYPIYATTNHQQITFCNQLKYRLKLNNINVIVKRNNSDYYLVIALI